MYAFKQWRATLGQRSHATQTNACKSVEHGHARACPRKCYTLSELEQLAEYNAVYMYTVDVHVCTRTSTMCIVYVHVHVRTCTCPVHKIQLNVYMALDCPENYISRPVF